MPVPSDSTGIIQEAVSDFLEMMMRVASQATSGSWAAAKQVLQDGRKAGDMFRVGFDLFCQGAHRSARSGVLSQVEQAMPPGDQKFQTRPGLPKPSQALGESWPHIRRSAMRRRGAQSQGFELRVCVVELLFLTGVAI